MPKHYKEMMDEIINKMPVEESNLRYSVKFAYQKGGKIANAFYKDKSDAEKFVKSVIAKGGKAILTTEDAPANAVAHGGVDMAPNAGKKKKKDEVPDELKKVIMKRMSGQIKEDNDNNNVVLKGVLDKLDTIDQAVDKLSGIENKVEFVEEKEHKSFKSKYAKDI